MYSMADPRQRRREQLRTAQQTYRRRKENTISNLQDRVHELECAIEQLSQSFLTFSNLLLETGLLGKHSHVTSALHKITQQYILLAETRCASPDEGAVIKAIGATSSTAFDKDERSSDSCARVTSNERSPRGHSLTPIEWAELASSYTQPSLYQDQSISPISLVMAPLTNESPTPLSSLPGHTSAIALATSIEEEQWTFSQYLVKACCQNGYQLLVNTPNDFVKVKEVFGSFMSPAERNHHISRFHAGIHDKTGGLIDIMATGLAPLRRKRDYFASKELPSQTETLEFAVTSEASEWLDASGVQKFLSERGVYTRENGSPLSRSSIISKLQIVALVKCEYLARHILVSKD